MPTRSSSSRATAPTTRRSTAQPAQLPFGFVPGGGASVFPRALGLPRNPVAAARADRRCARGGPEPLDRRSAGSTAAASASRRASGSTPRWCAASTRAGATPTGRRASNATFVGVVARLVVESKLRLTPAARGRGLRPRGVRPRRERPSLHLRRPGSGRGRAAGRLRRRARLRRAARRSARARSRLSWCGCSAARSPTTRDVLAGHDLDAFEVRCDRPLPLQADGEDLGDVTEAVFEAERDALAVLV